MTSEELVINIYLIIICLLLGFIIGLWEKIRELKDERKFHEAVIERLVKHTQQ